MRSRASHRCTPTFVPSVFSDPSEGIRMTQHFIKTPLDAQTTINGNETGKYDLSSTISALRKRGRYSFFPVQLREGILNSRCRGANAKNNVINRRSTYVVEGGEHQVARAKPPLKPNPTLVKPDTRGKGPSVKPNPKHDKLPIAAPRRAITPKLKPKPQLQLHKESIGPPTDFRCVHMAPPVGSFSGATQRQHSHCVYICVIDVCWPPELRSDVVANLV